MGGTVIIFGGSASSRIVLKSRLTAACYDVASFPDAEHGLGAARTGAPQAILIDLDLPDRQAADVVADIRSMPDMGDVPVLALARPGNDAARLAVLRAGADDVLTQPSEPVLLARLRNLLRHRAALADFGAGAAPVQRLGFAEGSARFDSPGQIALVMAQGGTALCLRRDLAARARHRIVTLAAPGAMQDLPAEVGGIDAQRSDVFVIGADTDSEASLRILAELRSRDHARHAAFCLVRPASAKASSFDAMAFDLGANDVIDPAIHPDELMVRLDRVLARKRVADRLRASVRDGLRLAMTDPLTGLSNRRFAVGRMAAMAEQARTLNTGVAVMIIDLDRFKAVNDRWGHAAGDIVLVEIAQRLAAAMRPDDLLARIGGEEFLVALSDTTLPEAQGVAERLRAAVQERAVQLPQGAALRVTASIGLALSAPGHWQRSDAVAVLLDKADQALLVAKSHGRNQVMVGCTAA